MGLSRDFEFESPDELGQIWVGIQRLVQPVNNGEWILLPFATLLLVELKNERGKDLNLTLVNASSGDATEWS